MVRPGIPSHRNPLPPEFTACGRCSPPKSDLPTLIVSGLELDDPGEIPSIKTELTNSSMMGTRMAAFEHDYQRLLTIFRELTLLESCGHLLNWDEQTCMPAGGSAVRADQCALMAGLAHERATSAELGELLGSLAADATAWQGDTVIAANLREARRRYQHATRLPRRLVEALSQTATLAQPAWNEARKAADFARFQPWLEQMVALKREQAAAIGAPSGQLYDALLDEFEPQATTAELTAAFAPLRKELVTLVQELKESGRSPRVEILERHYPREAQQQFAFEAARRIGFDFHRGRIDQSAHPFCSGIGPGDCRLTTRYDEHHFPGAFFGVLHEAGHGIYDQGLPPENFGTPIGDATSLGMHESQSRMWENLVGRSAAFWDCFYTAAQQAFPGALGDVVQADFHAAINDVRPSLIRVEADEVTYNLHVLLRFELEQALIAGDLSVADLPAAWNDRCHEFLGLTPRTAAEGCLQDIHWSGGLFGYFPTYTLGNIYAAQLFEAALVQVGDLPAMFARGEFEPLKRWLNQQIHQHGRRYLAKDLVTRITGQPPSHAALVRYLRGKYRPLYGLA